MVHKENKITHIESFDGATICFRYNHFHCQTPHHKQNNPYWELQWRNDTATATVELRASALLKTKPLIAWEPSFFIFDLVISFVLFPFLGDSCAGANDGSAMVWQLPWSWEEEEDGVERYRGRRWGYFGV